MNYSSIAWLPICAGLTAAGLVLSYYYGRRRGHRSMLRGAAWSLLPLAAWLTGSIEMFWGIGVAIGRFADGFVFSPVRWAGIGVAGISALLFFSTGDRSRRKSARQARKAARAGRKNAAAGPGGAGGADLTGAAGAAGTLGKAGTAVTRELDTFTLDTRDAAPVPGKGARPPKPPKDGAKKHAGADDDMKDIDEILRKRGI